jgi:alkanesulfonate monooxygenase SsuD/methylene tetrahydromethanopterin reductase-like flavin-dependent oxidoreductase (luciferase family)
VQFHLYLPQMRLSLDKLIDTARAAEAAGFEGMAGMDHLAPPLAQSQPMYEAMITNTWLAARTERLRLSSLVLCDAFRHPAQLAKEAVTLDHASGGRFELGIGWGSYQPDFDLFGMTPPTPAGRVRRLRETLQVMQALWCGETVDFEGEFFTLRCAQQTPAPLSHIPLTIGGAGPKTIALIRDFADWWNMDVRHLEKLDNGAYEALRGEVGRARVSLQVMVAYVHKGADRAAVTETTLRRFAGMKPVIGEGAELADYFAQLSERGVERIYPWFCDFGAPETLAAFGETVIAPLRR